MKILGIVTLLAFSQSLWASNYGAKVQEMQDLVSANKSLAQMQPLGQNDQSVPLWGLRIAFPTKRGLNKSRHLVVGTHHGNEIHAAPTVMEFAKQLVDIMKNPGHPYHQALRGKEFFVFPVLNVTGYDRRRRQEYNGQKWLDPNRDYPDPCVDKVSFELKSTKAIAGFMAAHNIVSAVTVHGYIGTFTFPWGMYTNQSHTHDHEHFVNWSRFAVAVNGYRIGTHKDVIYPATGAFEDYAYNEMGIWAMLLEIKRGGDLRKDAESMVRYFTQVPHVRSQNFKHDEQYCQKNIPASLLRRSRP